MSLSRLFSRIKKSKDATTLTKNFSYLLLLQISSYVFPLLTIPYLARVIGVDKFGEIAFAAAVVLWFKTISEWGFNYTATRDVARCRESKKQVSYIYSNVFWARCVLAIISFALLFVASLTIPVFKENQTLLFVTYLLVPGNILFPEWFFQGIERMKYITIFSFFSRLIFTISVFMFIKEKSDYILQPFFVALGYILSGGVAMHLILNRWQYKLYPPSFPRIYATIIGSTDVFINTILPNLYNSFSTVLLGFFGGSVANGILDAGNKLVQVAHQFIRLISRVFFPFLSRKINKHGVYVKLNLFIALFLSLFLFLFAPVFIKLLFTEEFYDAVIVLRILSFSIFFIALNNVFGVNYMIIKGYEKQLRNITISCSFFGFLIAWPFIYFYSFIGAAITIALTRTLLGVLVMIKARKI